MFEYEYGGTLDITMICTKPEFIAEESVRISVDKDGLIISEPATLIYTGESVMEGGQSKMLKEGSITFDPYSGCFVAENGDYNINLYENASGTEDMKLWVWDGDSWELEIEVNNIPIDWDGTLAFSINAAVGESGDQVGIQVAAGSVQYILKLVAVAPGLIE